MARFAAAAEQEPRVLAAFLGGSLAAGTADPVSDLDLYVVARAEDYASFFADREAFVRSWAEPLFLAETLDFEGLGFDMTHFVLGDGVHGELAFGHEGNFLALHGGPYEVLVDKVGLLDGVTFPLHLPSDEERRRAVEHALGWFFYDALNLGKLLVRGQLISAAAALASLRAHCTLLIEDDALAQRLFETVRASDVADMWQATFALVELHRTAGPGAADRYGLAYPDDLARVVERTLLRRARL